MSKTNSCSSKYGRALCRVHGARQPSFSKASLTAAVQDLNTQFNKVANKGSFTEAQELKDKRDKAQAQLDYLHNGKKQDYDVSRQYHASIRDAEKSYYVSAAKEHFGEKSDVYAALTAKPLYPNNYLFKPGKKSTIAVGDYGDPLESSAAAKAYAQSFVDSGKADGVTILRGPASDTYVAYKLKPGQMDPNVREEILSRPEVSAFKGKAIETFHNLVEGRKTQGDSLFGGKAGRKLTKV